jgi:hypothetical protein
MVRLRDDGLLPHTPHEFAEQPPAGAFGAKVIGAELPQRATASERAWARLWLHNASAALWPGDPFHGASGRLAVRILLGSGGSCLGQAWLRHDVHSGTETHVVVEFEAPDRPGDYDCRSELVHAADGSRGASSLRRWTLTVS